MIAQFNALPESFPPNQLSASIVLALRIFSGVLVAIPLVGIIYSLRWRPWVYSLLAWPSMAAMGLAFMMCLPMVFRINQTPDRYLIVSILIFLALTPVGFLISLFRLAPNIDRKSRSTCVWLSGVSFGIMAAYTCCPIFESSRITESTMRTDCKNRMRQIAIAIHDWHDVHGRLPDSRIIDNGNPPRSWRVDLLDYIELGDVRQQYRVNLPWDDAENLPIAKLAATDYLCPSVDHDQNRHDEVGRYFTHYLAVTGPNTIFANGKGMSLEDIAKSDGTSRTLLLVEASGRNIVWTEPLDADTSAQPMGINASGNSVYDSPSLLSTYHATGANVALADASVHTLRNDIDPKLLQALTTTNGNDPKERGF